MDLGMGLSPAASQCWSISMKPQKGRGVRGWYLSSEPAARGSLCLPYW